MESATKNIIWELSETSESLVLERGQSRIIPTGKRGLKGGGDGDVENGDYRMDTTVVD